MYRNIGNPLIVSSIILTADDNSANVFQVNYFNNYFEIVVIIIMVNRNSFSQHCYY